MKYSESVKEEITKKYLVGISGYNLAKKRNTKDKAFQIFEDKIVGYPNYKNKGIKIFPPDKK